jgi:hypothetical protein
MLAVIVSWEGEKELGLIYVGPDFATVRAGISWLSL